MGHAFKAIAIKHLLACWLLVSLTSAWAQQPNSAIEPAYVEFGTYRPEELALERYDKDPEANALILINQIKYSMILSGNPRIEVLIHKRIKVFTKAGADEFGKLEFGYTDKEVSVDQFKANVVINGTNGPEITEVAKGDYSELVEDDAGVTFKMAFPNVVPGSIVEYSYRMRLNLGFFFYLPDFYVQEDHPVLYSFFQTAYPPELTMTVFPLGFQVNYVQQGLVLDESFRSFTVNRFVAHHVEALREEPRSIWRSHFRARIHQAAVQFGTSKFPGTWSNYVTIFKYAISSQIISDGLIRNIAKQYPKDQFSQREIATSLFTKVAKDVSWNGRFSLLNSEDWSVSAGLEGKPLSSGAKNLLLISLLRACKIEAYPVITRTFRRGPFSFGIPIFQENNNILVKTTIDGKDYFMDATLYDHPPFTLPTYSQNSQGLLINDTKESEFSFVSTESATQVGREALTLSVTLKPETNTLEGTFLLVCTGEGSEDVRYGLLEDSLESAVKEYIFNEDAAITLSNVVLENPDSLHQPTRVTGSISIQAEVESIEGELYLRASYGNGLLQNPFTKETRQLPIFLGIEKTRTYMLQVALPEGYAVEQPPAPKRFVMGKPSPIVSYQRFCGAQPGSAMFSSVIQYHQPMVTPDHYGEVRQFFDLVAQSESEQLVIVKKTD